MQQESPSEKSSAFVHDAASQLVRLSFSIKPVSQVQPAARASAQLVGISTQQVPVLKSTSSVHVEVLQLIWVSLRTWVSAVHNQPD
jgi:hypothetical protein